LKNIPATKPFFSDDDIKYITKNFKKILSGQSFLSQYKYCAQFEKEFASYIGTDFAVSCNSGTSALELIFKGLSVNGKEVILPSNTFIATANAIMNAGGIPVFADCDESMCLDYNDTIQKVTPKTVAICHVHIGGIVSDSAIKLSNYCNKNGLYFVEDAAQAHGSLNQGRNAGTLGSAAGFSFFSTKVMTTGEGGMVTTDNEDLVIKMRSIREFGKEKKGIFTNYHTRIGYNWRMPEVSALMGIRQLKSIEYFIKKRNNIASIYDLILSELNEITIIKPPQNSRFNFFKYTLILKNIDRVTFHRAMEDRGVQLSGYIYELPLHKQPVFPKHNNMSLPVTESLCSKHVCLPIYPSLDLDDAKYIAKNVKKILMEYSK
jgi:perosamine synthetase